VFGINEVVQKLNFIQGDINRILFYVKAISKAQDKSKLYFSKVIIFETSTIIKGDIKEMNLDDLSKVTFTLEALNRKGQPAQVQNPTFTISDATLATGAQNPSGTNPLEFEVIRLPGTSGTFIVEATADADLGDGVSNLTAQEAVNATLAQANILSLKAGTPVDA